MKLEKLEMRGGFTRRHIGPDRHQIREMATYLGLDDLEQIVDRAVPESIISAQPLALTRTISEREVGVRLRRMRRRNRVFTSMIGMGYHDTIMPAVIKRNVLENPAWYTAYTPYQAEISQGRLEALLNFQQMITDLTGMEIANASMLDEATAAAEAMSMAKRTGKKDSRLFFVDRDCHPQTISVVRTRAHWFGYEVCMGDPFTDLADRDVFGALFQYPGSSGEVTDLRGPIEQAHGQGAIVSVAADILALVLLTPPGEMDADIVVGNTQRFGMPMGYGGPHGGSGPGMGPIGVKQHLAPFLPDHPLVEGVNPAAGNAGTVGAVSAAPWGSASILAISWAYIAMMGADGLRRATLVAILVANYVAARLREHYPILYTGKNGMVAHECILDLRPVRHSCNITVDDIAKRLVDYGFHAPTMSFPVPDTLMIEPTESENKRELDRFCDAMIAIRGEIAMVERGEWDRDNNPLKNAPHTHRLLLEPEWTMPYGKQQAFYPMDAIRDDKYWPPTGRVDNLHGDRNLFCSCPLPEDYSTG